MCADAGRTVPIKEEKSMRRFATLLAVTTVLLPTVGVVSAVRAEDAKTEFYGFVMMDMRYDAEAKDPAWFDVMRPTKLPPVEDGFGKGGNTSFSVRQTRFGVKSSVPTSLGDLKT